MTREEISRKDFLKLPMDERREILNKQVIESLKGNLLEGIAMKLYEFDGGTQEYWDSSPKDCKEYMHRAKLMAEYLHSQGVVIRVEREGNCEGCKHPLSPGGNHCCVSGCRCNVCNKYDDLAKAGLVFTESLIEEGV